jgi:uncharacterized BrkB/YihY/UPF0761 family membrane protein
MKTVISLLLAFLLIVPVAASAQTMDDWGVWSHQRRIEYARAGLVAAAATGYRCPPSVKAIVTLVSALYEDLPSNRRRTSRLVDGMTLAIFGVCARP